MNYLGIPVGKTAFPSDIAAKLDSMAVGHTSGIIENTMDNTLNVIRLIAKQQLPDSIEYRQIQVGGASADVAHKSADSIYAALKAGADFEAVAKKYGQTGQKAWMTTQQYQSAPSMDNDTKNYITSLNMMAVNETKNIVLPQGNIIVQVLSRKAMTDKYIAAVIKKNIVFSNETYSKAYNKFSSFVSANQTGDDIIKNAAKSGYRVQEANDITTAQHYLANIHGTRDALKWLFEAKQGAVSQTNPVGYRSLDDSQVKEMVKAEVMKDKKAEMLMSKLNGVSTLAAAKAKGAKVADVNQVTFAAPVFVTLTGASEPALSGAVYATAKGKFSTKAVKGNAGVYMFQVTNKTMRPGKFDDKTMEQKLRQKTMQYAGNFMNELYINAKVVDNRYLFF